MSAVVLGEHPGTAWLERRRALGQDGRDEVWEGVYHVAPMERPHNGIVAGEVLHVLRPYAEAAHLVGLLPFNLGSGVHDYRVPDAGWLHRDQPLELFMPTATAVLEVLSPDDESYAKLPYYAARGVQEVLIAHPTERWVQCWSSRSGQQRTEDASAVFGIGMDVLVEQVRWP